MFAVFADLNWLAVAAGFAAYVVLGGLWFTVLFSKAYNVSLGRPADAPPVREPAFFVGPPLCALAVTVATAVLLHALKIDTYGDALLFALIAGVGYLAANTTMIAINPNFPRPLRYAAISGAYNLVGIAIVSVLVVAIR